MKQIFSIKNSNAYNSAECLLLMEVGAAHCCWAIAGSADKTIHDLGYYLAEHDDPDFLSNVLNNQPQLKEHFHQAIVAYYIPEALILPEKHFHHEHMQAVADAIYGKDGATVITDAITSWQLNVIYKVPAQLQQQVSRQFHSGNFWHVHSVALKAAKDLEGETILVDFKTESFSATVLRGHSLLLAQIYPYANGEDVLYWLLKICEQYSLSRSEVSLVLSGLVEKNSAMYSHLHQYFLNIQFDGVNGMKLGAGNGDHPEHFFSSLYKLAACVS